MKLLHTLHYPGNQDPHKSVQRIRSSNSQSRLPRDQRSTTESTEIHGKENPNQLPLSVSSVLLTVKIFEACADFLTPDGLGSCRKRRNFDAHRSLMQSCGCGLAALGFPWLRVCDHLSCRGNTTSNSSGRTNVSGTEKRLSCVNVPEMGSRHVIRPRCSFRLDAVRWLRSAKQGAALCKLVINPDRPDRVKPRVVKRRPKEYDRMTRPRAELRRRLLEGAVAA